MQKKKKNHIYALQDLTILTVKEPLYAKKKKNT